MLKDIYDIFEDKKHGLYQIRCKNEVITVEFNDTEKEQIFLEIINEAPERQKDLDFAQLTNHLVKKYKKEKVLDVLNNLKELDILEENNIKDNFANELRVQLNFFSRSSNEYGSACKIQNKIENTKILMLGNEFFINILGDKASISGFKQIEKIKVADDSELDTKIETYISECDFLIVDTDRWYPLLLEKINQIAIEYDKPWIIIMGIDGTVASVGPLFVGKETGCYNCLIMRLKSCMEFLPYFEEFEKHLKQTRKRARSGGSFVVIYDIIASISIIEALKYITQITVPVLYKNFITFDFFSYEVNIHPFLKVPGCSICGKKIEFNPSPWLEPITLKRNLEK